MAKRKPCAVPLCPAWRKAGSFVCAAHDKASTVHNGLLKQPKAHKFGAIATTVNGIRFDSKAEAARYQDLLLLERAGEVIDLCLQTKWPLVVNGVELGFYVSDFDYIPRGAKIRTVEDTKGVRTPVYRIKYKLMKALYGITILETA